eukprot:1367732-Amphidinium_carterae.1
MHQACKSEPQRQAACGCLCSWTQRLFCWTQAHFGQTVTSTQLVTRRLARTQARPCINSWRFRSALATKAAARQPGKAHDKAASYDFTALSGV